VSPRPDPWKARTFKAIGWALLVAALVLGISFTPLAAIIPVFLGYTCLRRSKKFAVEFGEAVVEKDTRAPVLYLRSFQDEEGDSTLAGQFKNIWASGRDLADTVPPVGIREQDALGHVLRKIGPYIALGKPGEGVPELGSTKLYVPNESWQATVLDLLARSRLIIFRAGQTEALRWELTELVKRVNPLKVAMILPVTDESYLRFVGWANSILPGALPQDYPASRIIVFDEKWRPSYVPRGPTLTKTFAPFFAQNQVIVNETFWEQFLEHNGVRW
jgi:hypothetical protein